MRQQRDALPNRDIRQRVLQRHHEVVRNGLEILHERGRHAMRTRLDVNRRGLRLEVVLGIRLAHPSVELERRHALAVDRHVNLLFQAERAHRRSTGQPAERLVVHRRLEDVFAVGREHVDFGHAAASTDRRAVDVRHLRSGARNLVGDRGRGRRCDRPRRGG